MPKCWIHGVVADETEKKSTPKTMKEHPGHPEDNSLQNNLGILLAPKPQIRDLAIQPYRYWEFEDCNNQIKGLKNQLQKTKKEKEEFIEEQLKREQELENEFHQKEQQWEINFQHIVQREKKKDKEIEDKNKRILEQTEKITKAVEVLKKKDKEIEEKQKNIKKLEVELENSEPKDAHVISFLTHLQEDLKSELASKKEIEKQVKDLEKQQEEDKLARDKELQELKQKIVNLTAQLETVQNIDAEVYKVLGEYSQETGLLLRSQEVVKKLKRGLVEEEIKKINEWTEEVYYLSCGTKKSSQEAAAAAAAISGKITNLKGIVDSVVKIINEKNELKTSLHKELTWWDKWFEDRDDSLRNRELKYKGLYEIKFSTGRVVCELYSNWGRDKDNIKKGRMVFRDEIRKYYLDK